MTWKALEEAPGVVEGAEEERGAGAETRLTAVGATMTTSSHEGVILPGGLVGGVLVTCRGGVEAGPMTGGPTIKMGGLTTSHPMATLLCQPPLSLFLMGIELMAPMDQIEVEEKCL